MTLEKLTEILNDHDPMGLLSMGAPSDEYISEAKEIYRHLSRNQALTFIWELVYWVFSQFFNTGASYVSDGMVEEKQGIVFLGDYAGPKERYINIAMDIFLELREEAKL